MNKVDKLLKGILEEEMSAEMRTWLIELSLLIEEERALHQPPVRYQLAISALEAIVDPIGHMRKQLNEDERLDGMYAIRIAERPEFYQDIAKKALEEIANCT